MTRYEKITLTILAIVMFLSNLVLILWALKDLDETYSSLVLSLVAAPIIGYATSIHITKYYRNKDQKERIAYSLYGLQNYLKQIQLRLDDLINAEKRMQNVKWDLAIDRLEETLRDEPFSIFLILAETKLDEMTASARTAACLVLAELENLIIYDEMWPTYIELVSYKSRIVKARMELLKVSSNINILNN